MTAFIAAAATVRLTEDSVTAVTTAATASVIKVDFAAVTAVTTEATTKAATASTMTAA
jgi:hypothetical protein